MSWSYSSQQQQEHKRGPGPHKPITGIVGAATLIRVTVAAHGWATGNRVDISGVIGTVEANKASWVITVFDVNSFDLQGSTFVNPYISGGMASLV